MSDADDLIVKDIEDLGWQVHIFPGSSENFVTAVPPGGSDFLPVYGRGPTLRRALSWVLLHIEVQRNPTSGFQVVFDPA